MEVIWKKGFVREFIGNIIKFTRDISNVNLCKNAFAYDELYEAM
jgi:hypothetical protein